MEIDKDKLIAVLVSLLDQQERIDRELLFYRVFVEGLEKAKQFDVAGLLNGVRSNPKINEMVRQKYSDLRRIVERTVEEGNFDQELVVLIRDHKLTGPEN